MKRIVQITAAAMLALGLSATVKAAEINLTTAGASGTSATGVIFSETDLQPTGTGVIDPFLRLQNTGTEAGINTSVAPILDDKEVGNYTHDLPIGTLQQIPGSQITGADPAQSYYKFLLDINQVNSSPLLNLNTIQFFVTGSAITDVNTLLALPGSAPKFDALGGDDVLMDYSLNAGSGQGDMFMYVPVNDIGTSGYLYLYNVNGTPNNSNDGFEEWAGQTGPSPSVPDASTTLMLLGMAFVGIEGLRRKLYA